MNGLRLLATIIFFSAMGYMWQSLKDNRAPAPVAQTPSSTKPDYVAINLTRTVYDSNGQRTQRLTADKMTFYKAEDKAEFQSPLLILQSSENKGRWRISSQSGILYNNQELLLEHNVDAVNLTLTDPIDQITGDYVRIDTQASTMHSEHPVNLYGDGVIITGSEMTADLNQEHIELKKHAKTTYIRNSN